MFKFSYMVQKQIGWSYESNLLADISKQLDRLTQVMFSSKYTLPYKVYTALFEISGDEYTAGIIEDTTTGIVFTKFGRGNIRFNKLDETNFLKGKTAVFLTMNELNTTISTAESLNTDNPNIDVKMSDLSGSYVDGSFLIEIRIYN